MSDKPKYISPEMTILDIISKYRETEVVFKRYDEKAGECICCQALFDTVQDVAQRYGLNLDELLAEIDSAACDDKISEQTSK
ncbi:MAG: hypothetical protein JW932_18555 [Deltaproteobacteria bacterium]|nr:hypothetical protein [Deltaproteobacteria bacterium]